MALKRRQFHRALEIVVNPHFVNWTREIAYACKGEIIEMHERQPQLLIMWLIMNVAPLT